MKNLVNRRPNFKFSEEIPKFWLDNSIFRTHLLNSFTLIFPAGEQFFIRSINSHIKHIEKPALKKEAKEFLKQEAQHAREHEKFFRNLKDQGYKIDHITHILDKFINKVFEPNISPKMCLAVTAGLEHFTALLAEIGLQEKFLENAHPIMKELFEWHAAEEIEHRSVAFDVLQAVDDSYMLRVSGLVFAYLLLAIFSGGSTLYLISSDKVLFDKKVLKEISDTLLTKEKLFFKSLQICLLYLKPDFHPSNNDLDHLSDLVFSKTPSWQVA
jgi:predicted metal-dependent hydrolase